MAFERVGRVVRLSAHSVVLLVVCKPALATIEITGNSFPTNVNVPGNFNAVSPGVVVGINGNPPGNGSLIVNGGSVLTSSFATVGELSNGVGNVSISAGTWNTSGALNVGLAGSGTMSAQGTNAVSAPSITLGAQSSAIGLLTVSGSNPLTSPGGLVVGDAGSGQFTISPPLAGGASTQTLPFVNIGDESSGNGTATLQANPGTTTLNVSGHLGIGVRGTGTLNLNGPTTGSPTVFLNTASATLADQTDNGGIKGTANLSGRSSWTNTGALVVGNAARGAVTMNGGSSLSTATLEVGRSSVGTLTLQGGGLSGSPTTLTNSGLATLGTNAGSSGTVTIGGSPLGAAWNWNSSGLIEVGRGGTGTLNINAGGTVTSSGGVIGRNASSSGAATVSGTGALWTVNGDLHVGGSASGAGGSGQLNIHTSGQTTITGSLRIWPAGLISLSGGNLSANSIQHDGAAARLAISGGTLTTNSIVAPDGFAMSGGTVNANTITATTTPNTTITGGTLHVVTYTGNLTNNGATLAPGNSPGTTTVVGNYAQNSPGRLEVEIASTASFDKLAVTGNLAISGALLDVLFLPGYVPAAGHSFDILDWGSIQLIGGGWTLSLPALGGGLTWDQSQLYTTGVLSIAAPGVPGDYNNNGVVDAADYVLWRNGGPLANEVDNPGTVNAADYTTWRSRFGNTNGTGIGAAMNSNAAVPEPSAVVLFIASLMFVPRKYRK